MNVISHHNKTIKFEIAPLPIKLQSRQNYLFILWS
jgi:hypothetical protein